MTRSRQFLRLFQSSVPLAFTGEGESQTHEPHYEGSLLGFFIVTLIPLPLSLSIARACVWACAAVHADRGERAVLAATRIRALTSLPFSRLAHRLSFPSSPYTTSTEGYALTRCGRTAVKQLVSANHLALTP